MKEILDRKIIDLENFHLTVFSLVLVFIILIITWLGLKIIKRVIERPWKNLPADGGRRHSIYLITRYLVVIVSAIFCLQIVGIQITILLAGSAALLVGLGLGIQQLFNDIVSGIFLLFEGSVQVGDILEIDDLVCQVKEIHLRTSKVETRDNIIKIVPNHKFISEIVTNWSKQTTNNIRFRMVMGVSYKSDPQKVRDLITNVMLKHPEVIQIEGNMPFVRFVDYADSSINFELVFWSQQRFRIDNVMSDIRYEVFKRFKEEGIEIPFPQRDLHLRSSSLEKNQKI
jgi:small-conductance mechanosensitive channel